MNIEKIGFPIKCFSECMKSEPNGFVITSSVAVAGIALIGASFMAYAKYKEALYQGHAILPLQSQMGKKEQQIQELRDVTLTLVQENETLKQTILAPAQIKEKDQQIKDLENINRTLVQAKEDLQQRLDDPELFSIIDKERIEALEAENRESTNN